MTADTLHARLEAEIRRRLDVARAAAAAKPGEWSAVTTHDGTGHDGLSRVLATQQTADRTITRHVADGISDVPEPVRTSFADDEPEPAVVAEHIALHDPADAVRRYERDLKTLERHRPVEVHTNIDPRMVACAYEWGDSDGHIVPYEFCPHVKDLADDYLTAAGRLGVSVDG